MNHPLKYPLFGFDLDDVIFTTFSNILNILESEFDIKDFVPTGFGVMEGMLPAEDYRYVINKAIIENVEFLRPVEGALQFLKYYHELTGYDLIFITSREPCMAEATVYLLEKWIPHLPHEVFFSKIEQRTKGEIAEELAIQVFIEDRVKYCRHVAQKGILAIMPARSWNAKILNSDDRKGILRVGGWDDIRTIFDALIHFYDALEHEDDHYLPRAQYV
jgi:hypothetical protein